MQGFTWIDTVVLAAYLAGIATLGSVLGRGQKDVGDYFLGGRTFHWLPIALSVIATDLSAITYMGSPALAFQRDLRYLPVILTAPVAVLITVPIMVSVFYRMKIFTIYEYLERRYGIVLRVLASILFLTMRGGWLATAIFVPSLALSVVANANMTACIFGIGLFATFYAAVGGFKGVIWCDVVQFFILVGGVDCRRGPDGFSRRRRGHLGPGREQGPHADVDFDYHFAAEYTLWSVLVGGLVSYMSAAGADQVTVQRYLSARSLGVALKSGWRSRSSCSRSSSRCSSWGRCWSPTTRNIPI